MIQNISCLTTFAKRHKRPFRRGIQPLSIIHLLIAACGLPLSGSTGGNAQKEKPTVYLIGDSTVKNGKGDSGPLNDTLRARGTIRGNGDESEDIDNLITKKHETVHSYGWYLRKYIEETKAKGATPVVLSLVPRNIWKDGQVGRAGARVNAAAVAEGIRKDKTLRLNAYLLKQPKGKEKAQAKGKVKENGN